MVAACVLNFPIDGIFLLLTTYQLPLFADFFLSVGLGLGGTDTPQYKMRKSISNERTFSAIEDEALLFQKLGMVLVTSTVSGCATSAYCFSPQIFSVVKFSFCWMSGTLACVS